MMMALPVALAAKWAAWFAVGLALSIWGRREKMYVATAYEEHFEAPAKPHRHPRVAPATVPASSGDAFSDLAALFEPQEGTHRMPGEAPAASPVHAEAPAPSPVLAESPRLAAPQSLP